MTQESHYYVGYNIMLHHCFCDNSQYMVAPQAPAPNAPRMAVDFMVLLVVLDERLRPFLFVEVKDGSWLLRPSSCKRANSQM